MQCAVAAGLDANTDLTQAPARSEDDRSMPQHWGDQHRGDQRRGHRTALAGPSSRCHRLALLAGLALALIAPATQAFPRFGAGRQGSVGIAHAAAFPNRHL